MAFLKRLRLLTAVLGAGAATTVVGSAVFGDLKAGRPVAAPLPRVEAVGDKAARTRFSDTPALAYKLPDGGTVFAWQVKPNLPAVNRPRDLLVMVDTSASQAGTPLLQARHILAGLAAAAGPNDRLDVWTVNIDNPAATRSLTGGFQPAKSEALTAAQGKLAETEYGSGAVDLKPALEAAARQFPKGDRNAAIIYLGDGESAASAKPFTEAVRAEAGNRLADRDVAFFAVPLGGTVHPHNLHGLAATTGGSVVRPTGDPLAAKGQADTAAAVLAAVDVPVLRADKPAAFGPAGVEVFPTRLPPLRADRATLVIGKLAAPAQTLSVRVEGRVNGRAETIDLSERLPAPEAGNYFLAAMIDQWRAAPAPDAPAVLAADRTLAVAAEQFRLYRDEFAGQGTVALTAERLDHAEKLFQAALRLDPAAPDAAAGISIISQLRTGKVSTQKVNTLVKAGTALARVAQDPPAPAPGIQPPAPIPGATPAEQQLIDQARAAQQVAEQEFRVLVDDTLRRARRLTAADPDGAYEDLKRQRDGVLSNDQLGEAARRRLVSDLEAAMREVQLKGGQVKRDLASQRERTAQARQRLAEFDRQQTLEEQTRARVDSFKQLMQQAKFELAQQEAQVMIQERVNRGLGIPPETYAAYRIGQSAGSLREQRELRRIKEDRYLLTMLQVDKSFIPYPDEPPVHFPPAAVWRELTGRREQNYGPGSLGANVPESFRRVRSLLEGETDRRVNLRDLSALTLGTMIQELQNQFQEYNLRFVFRTELFPEDIATGIRDRKLKTQGDLSGLPLGAFLDTVLRDLEMSWIARPEYIEIGPNTAAYSLRYDEKVTKVFDVASLIIGIPNAQSTSQLLQNLQFLGQQATIFGAALNPFNGLNPFGFAGGAGVGGFGGAGAFGGGGLGGGGFGGGLGGGGAPFAGGGAGGQQLGAGGFQGGGFQGGGVGLQGGGVAGNPTGGLAGQFGIQGNDQSKFLLALIFDTVANKEWQIPGGLRAGQDIPADYTPKVPPEQANTLGLYPPSRSLVVRASHRYHNTPTFDLRRERGGMGAGGPGLKGRGDFAAADPIKAAEELVKKAGKEPAKVWNQAFAGELTKPDAVVDAASALFELKEYAHAAEALKAGLRHGRATGGWAQEALTVALKSAQATPAEVERAALSAVDLEPADPRAFLKAAETESELGRSDVALAFCQRAAALEPNLPASYVDALRYAERGNEVVSDSAGWAVANLLGRDWPADGRDLHGLARTSAATAVRKLTAAGKTDAATKLAGVAGGDGKRDLVVELLWQGTSDLDLSVEEPAGSVCSATHKRTVGGGVLRADLLDQKEDNRSEVYTAVSAFTGTYTARVKLTMADTLRGAKPTARLKVTRFQGTPHETVQLVSVDLADPKPVAITFEGGSRTDLATVPMDPSEGRLATTLAPQSADQTFAVSQPTVETKVPGVAGMPGLRVEQKLSADRKRVEMQASPVFAGPARDIPAPKVGLLPGGN